MDSEERASAHAEPREGCWCGRGYTRAEEGYCSDASDDVDEHGQHSDHMLDGKKKLRGVKRKVSIPACHLTSPLHACLLITFALVRSD